MKLFGKQRSLSSLSASNEHVSIAVSKHLLILSSFFPIQNRLKTGSLDNAIREFSLSYLDNSLHLARKYAGLFVRGHYPFRKANSFPRAKPEED